ncbi:MAG: His/Gly/Thr/Pro-type tRNA ligase C-terminal domain-containing protein, partial [Planctomycetota bacterium]
KCAVLPLVAKEGMPERARSVIERFLAAGIPARFDVKGSIGKRYAKHDEIGTPCCITIDGTTLDDGTVTLRDRDSTEQIRVSVDEAIAQVQATLTRR